MNTLIIISKNNQKFRIRILDILEYTDLFCGTHCTNVGGTLDCHLSPFTGIVQVFTVAAAGCHVAAFPVPVHILAAA